MSMGGGTFLTQNKLLPGSYVKFISAVRANATLRERGVTALLIPTKWNPRVLYTLRPEEMGNTLALFGYEPDSAEMRPLREAFCSCATVLVYTVGAGIKAKCDIAEATCAGSFGNNIVVRVSQNPEWDASNQKMDIITTVNGKEVDRQIGVNANVILGEIRSNDYVTFDPMVTLDRPSSYFLKGGMSETVTVAHYQAGLDRLERETFHTLAYDGTDEGVRALFSNYTRRMREECGALFQCVLSGEDANYRGVVNAEDPNAVCWIAGALAGCAVNESLTNTAYNGECELTVPETQHELISSLETRKFTFHNVGGVLRVLSDRNSEDDPLFGQNQAVRVLDQIAGDIAYLFSGQYLGKIQNNRAGRMSFWNDTVTLLSQLQELGAIDDFSAQDVAVEEGMEKNAITVTAKVRPVCGMEKLYLTVTVL